MESAVQATPPASRRARVHLGPGSVAVGLSAVVFTLRVLLARPLSFCGTPDACFYLGMAKTLASGQGFHARFLYDFQQAHPTLPNTGLEYWRPGVSLLLAALRLPGGVTLQGSIAVTSLVGILFAAAAWHMAAHASLDKSVADESLVDKRVTDRRVALGAFAFCLLSSPAWVGSSSPDSGLYYGAAVGWFLALFTVRRQGLLQDGLALLCVGVAYLIRNDAALLLVPLVAVLWMRRRRGFQGRGPDGDGASPAYVAAMLAGFLVVLAPMHLLYRAVLGTAFPSGTAQVLFLNDLGDFGRYGDRATMHSLLAHGVKHLLVFRATTLLTTLYRVAVLMIGYPALVFLPGLFLHRETGQERGGRERCALPEFTGPVSFGLTALLVYTLVLPAIGGFSMLRTTVGLMPFFSVLVVAAIVSVARTPRTAVWVGAGVIGANALAGLMELRRALPVAEMIGTADRAEARQLAAMGAGPAKAVVLTGDPVQFSVTTGYATVALPSNGLDAIAQAARDFGATHVILDSDSLPAPLPEIVRALHPVASASLPREHSLILELPSTSPVP